MAVQDEGSVLTARSALNFTGSGVTASDDAANNRINVAITGPGGSSTSDIPLLVDGVLIAYASSTGISRDTTTAYTYPGGTGDRRSIITVTAAAGFLGGTPDEYVNGITNSGNLFWSGASAGKTITFAFGGKFVITEARYYQALGVSHGTWKWQGSLDGSAYTDIGFPFVLGGATMQVHTQLNGNIIAYRYYRLLGISGTDNSGPNQYECEFKISLPQP